LQGKDSINVRTETLTDDLASTMAKVRAVQYKNRGSIPHKGKEFSLYRKVHSSSGAHPISLFGIGDAFPTDKAARGVRLTTQVRLVPNYLCTPSAILTAVQSDSFLLAVQKLCNKSCSSNIK